ncbi:MAG: hyaluronoglucosaminidase [Solirubrobacteraceae bacterium]
MSTAQYDAVGIGATPPAVGLAVVGTATGNLAVIQQTGTAGHALTATLSAAGGKSQAAINAVSANPAFSAVEITGCETAHGTLKIAHKGYADGSDANAAAISLDLKTTTGTGTRCQGIYITSTTDTLPYGDPIKVRYNSLDHFVVKGGGGGGGIVGVGIPIGHAPAGVLEVAQSSTAPPLALTNSAAGKTVLLSVDDAGNLVATMPSGAQRIVAAA